MTERDGNSTRDQRNQDPIAGLNKVLADAVPHHFSEAFADQVIQQLRDDDETETGVASVLARIPQAFAWSLVPVLALVAFVAWQNIQLPGGGPVLAGSSSLPELTFAAGLIY